MKTRVCTALFALALLPALSGTAHAQALTADQVVEKHLTSVGGRAAISKITSRRATGTMTISTPAGDIGGPIEMTAKAPTKMRAIIRVDLTPVGGPGEMVIDQSFDGTNGVMGNSLQGDSPMVGDQLEGAKNGYFPSPLMNYKEHGVTIVLEKNQQVLGRDAYVLLMTPKSGPASRMFFDAQSFMLVRTVSTVNNAQLGVVEQITEPGDYRTVDGVQVAFTLRQSAAGQNVTMAFTKVEHNVTIDDAYFIKK